MLLLLAYLGMSKFTSRQVGRIQILNESKDHILLPLRVETLENKLNEIKGNVERTEADVKKAGAEKE